MSIIGEERKTTMTVPHRRLIELLEGCGFTVEVEVSFPPRWVDCYLPDHHVAFEADGPSHSREKDLTRDAHLMAYYALPVYHLTSEQLTMTEPERSRFLLGVVLDSTWSDSLLERRVLAKKAGAFQEASG